MTIFLDNYFFPLLFSFKKIQEWKTATTPTKHPPLNRTPLHYPINLFSVLLERIISNLVKMSIQFQPVLHTNFILFLSLSLFHTHTLAHQNVMFKNEEFARYCAFRLGSMVLVQFSKFFFSAIFFLALFFQTDGGVCVLQHQFISN